jgi:hypothetical protein
MKYHVQTALALGLGLLIFGLAEVEAQPATSFEQLQLLVKAGDTVSVTASSGQVIKGKIAQLSRSSIRLVVKGVPRNFAEVDVSEIKQRRSDSLGNGARNGAIAGAVFGVIGAFFSDCRSGSCAGDRVAEVAVTTALCTGIGVGIDALIVGTQVVYRPRGRITTGFKITPLLTRREKGINVSVSF